ncbi:hypothetical protein DL771_009005 [Monosporascus sp. 5C6A]|nr:hypothetical protein DL771_009005 [Monosporascus sp. 5C6A]
MGEYVLAPDVEAEFDLAVQQDFSQQCLPNSSESLYAKPGPLELGRADALNARTQQYLEIVGILDDLLPKGIKCNNLGRTVRGKYAVAADGARSTVRSALNISFTGTKPEMVWMVLDTFIDTDFPVCSEIITFQLNGQSRVSWIPRERGMARFYVLQEGETTQERAENSIREHLAPYRVDFMKTEWFSTFDVKERIASTFVSNQGSGRIILAGDAAHVHSVNGGQGLNTGIADAFALSWRVITAIKCKKLAPGAALDLIRSYDTERRQVAQGVIDVAARLVRDTVHTAKQYVATIEKNAGYITGMGVSYDGLNSELISESERGLWKAVAELMGFVLQSGY